MMNITLIAFIMSTSALILVKGEFLPSSNFLKGMFERSARDKCTLICFEKKEGCKEYSNNIALCESSKVKTNEENYNMCYVGCKKSTLHEKSVACSYKCIGLMFKMEGLSLPDGYFNGFIDSLSEQ